MFAEDRLVMDDNTIGELWGKGKTSNVCIYFGFWVNGTGQYLDIEEKKTVKHKKMQKRNAILWKHSKFYSTFEQVSWRIADMSSERQWAATAYYSISEALNK